MPATPAAMGEPSKTHIFVSGAFAGVVSRTATAPLDRLTMMQQAGCVGPSSCIASSLRAMYREGGIPALFRGNSASVVKSIPEIGVRFTVFETCLSWQYQYSRRGEELTLLERLMPGAMAGVASCACVYPLDVAKTRIILASHHTCGSVLSCLRMTVQEEGASALVRGLRVSLLRVVPFCAIDLAIYSGLREHVVGGKQRRAQCDGQQQTDGDTVALLACGAISSAVAQVATYPLALMGTLMQASGLPAQPQRYHSLLECARAIIAVGGVRSLYRGLLPTLLRSVPSLAISYPVFERCKRTLAPGGTGSPHRHNAARA